MLRHRLSDNDKQHTAGRIVCSGKVCLKSGGKINKERHLKATCGISETQPARLELFTDTKSAAKGKSKLQEIPFHTVSDISIHEDRSINLQLANGSEFSFYADILDELKEWFQYCNLLSTIPYYYVPEEPNYNLVPLNFIDRFKDPTEFDAELIWVTHIIRRENVCELDEGLYIVTIGSDLTFNIYDCLDKKHLLSWNSQLITGSGYVRSIVYLEAEGEELRGHSILWMSYPTSEAASFCTHLNNLVHESQRHGSRNNHGSCDSGIVESLIPRTNSGYKAVLFGKDSSNVVLNMYTNRPNKKKSNNSMSSTCNHPRSKPTDVVHNKLKHSATGTISRSSSCEWSDSSVDLHLSRTNSLESVNKSNIDCDSQTESTQLKCNDSQIEKHSLVCSPSSLSGENLSEMISCDNEAIVDDTVLPNFSKALSPIQEGNSPKSPLSTASGTCAFEPGPIKSDEATEKRACIKLPTIKLQENENRNSKVLPNEPDHCLNIWDALRDDDIQKRTLETCHPILTRKLNAVILEQLQKKQLLTGDDCQYLLSDSRTHEEIAEYLVNNLHRKQKGWFQSFLWCLKQSTSGTGHDVIYEALVSKYEELRKCTSDNKIDGNDVTKKVTGYNQQSHSEGSITAIVDIEQQPDIASITEMVTPFMSTKWFEMGLQLGVPSSELTRIEYDTQDSRIACRHMFREWLGNTQAEKSWKKLLKALRSHSVGESALAKHLISNW